MISVEKKLLLLSGVDLKTFARWDKKNLLLRICFLNKKVNINNVT